MGVIKHSDQDIEEFIFDCMLENDIKYMPTAKMLQHSDYSKYGAIARSGGTKFWRGLLKLQTKDEYLMMVRRKERIKCGTAMI